MTPPRLRDSPDDLAALVDAAARHHNVPQAFVEKDFWVMEVLRSAAALRAVTTKYGEVLPVRTVFKGGTSLSRGYGIIERFSEDVDLLVAFPSEASAGARDRILKEIGATVGEDLGLDSGNCHLEGSSTGVKRNIRYAYPAAYGSESITEGVLLEMGTRGGDFPTVPKQIRSIAAEYAIHVLSDRGNLWAEFEPVLVEVLAPERTLLEKIAAVHDAVTRLPELSAANAVDRGGRHFYDIHRLLNNQQVVGALEAAGPEGLAEIVEDIRKHSQAANFPYTDRPAQGYATSRAFIPDPDARAHVERAYERSTALIYGYVPTLDECFASVHRAAQLL